MEMTSGRHLRSPSEGSILAALGIEEEGDSDWEAYLQRGATPNSLDSEPDAAPQSTRGPSTRTPQVTAVAGRSKYVTPAQSTAQRVIPMPTPVPPLADSVATMRPPTGRWPFNHPPFQWRPVPQSVDNAERKPEPKPGPDVPIQVYYKGRSGLVWEYSVDGEEGMHGVSPDSLAAESDSLNSSTASTPSQPDMLAPLSEDDGPVLLPLDPSPPPAHTTARAASVDSDAEHKAPAEHLPPSPSTSLSDADSSAPGATPSPNLSTPPRSRRHSVQHQDPAHLDDSLMDLIPTAIPITEISIVAHPLLVEGGAPPTAAVIDAEADGDEDDEHLLARLLSPPRTTRQHVPSTADQAVMTEDWPLQDDDAADSGHDDELLRKLHALDLDTHHDDNDHDAELNVMLPSSRPLSTTSSRSSSGDPISSIPHTSYAHQSQFHKDVMRAMSAMQSDEPHVRHPEPFDLAGSRRASHSEPLGVLAAASGSTTPPALRPVSQSSVPDVDRPLPYDSPSSGLRLASRSMSPASRPASRSPSRVASRPVTPTRPTASPFNSLTPQLRSSPRAVTPVRPRSEPHTPVHVTSATLHSTSLANPASQLPLHTYQLGAAAIADHVSPGRPSPRRLRPVSSVSGSNSEQLQSQFLLFPNGLPADVPAPRTPIAAASAPLPAVSPPQPATPWLRRHVVAQSELPQVQPVQPQHPTYRRPVQPPVQPPTYQPPVQPPVQPPTYRPPVQPPTYQPPVQPYHPQVQPTYQQPAYQPQVQHARPLPSWLTAAEVPLASTAYRAPTIAATPIASEFVFPAPVEFHTTLSMAYRMVEESLNALKATKQINVSSPFKPYARPAPPPPPAAPTPSVDTLKLQHIARELHVLATQLHAR